MESQLAVAYRFVRLRGFVVVPLLFVRFIVPFSVLLRRLVPIESIVWFVVRSVERFVF